MLVHLSMLSGFYLTDSRHNILIKPLAAIPHDHIIIVDTTDRGEGGEEGREIEEREMNPDAVTIVSPRKEYLQSRGSNQLKTEIHRLGKMARRPATSHTKS